MLWKMLIKIGTKIVRHGRYVIFQMAEVAVPRTLIQIKSRTRQSAIVHVDP